MREQQAAAARGGREALARFMRARVKNPADGWLAIRLRDRPLGV